MSEVVFGEVDWNSGDAVDGSGSDFMKLEQGKTRVRVMGNPVQFYVHWVETPNGQKKKVVSPVGDPALVRKLDDAGFRRKPRWLVKVLDRSTEQFKILEISSQIYSGIKALYSDDDWGPVTQYDVNLSRGAPGSQPLYRVTPCPKAPLEASYKESYTAFNDRIDLNKFIQPSDPAEVRKMMGWSQDGSSSSGVVDDDLFQFEG